MRFFLAASLALAARPALARALPIAKVTETVAYAAQNDAAVAALRVALPESGEHEFGGIIVELGGAFYYTDPVSNGDDGDIAFKAVLSAGSRFMAIYHTHPSMKRDARLFSPHDVDEARRLGVDSYIGVWRDGTVRFFDPRSTRTFAYNSDGAGLGPRVSKGVIIARLRD